jgi:hypothetical protein
MSRRRAVDLRRIGFFATVFLRLGVFFATFFFATFFFATFFFATFFLAAGFFFATFFFATFFLAAGFFLAARFLLARLLEADFLAIAFLFATFFLLADFFVAGFFRATAFFLDDFFADTFRFVTFRLFPEVFFRADGRLLAAFFREDLAALRFLLAVFFAGILTSCRSEKNAQLYIACSDMEARISRFLSRFSRPWTGVLEKRLGGRRTALETAIQAAFSIFRIRLATIVLCDELHYTTPNSRAWA